MIIRTLDDVTADALAAMESTEDPRLRDIMASLVKHLHAFVRDVRLTEPEFRQAAAILNEMGKLSSDSHNEPMLMAGSLGVSSLVCLLNNGDDGNSETSQSLLGPFWRLNSPRVANGGTIVRSDTPGDPLIVTARVVDRSRAPIAVPFTAPEGRGTPAWWTPLDTRSLDLITRARFRRWTNASATTRPAASTSVVCAGLEDLPAPIAERRGSHG